jgi:hypothetical protein
MTNGAGRRTEQTIAGLSAWLSPARPSELAILGIPVLVSIPTWVVVTLVFMWTARRLLPAAFRALDRRLARFLAPHSEKVSTGRRRLRD